MKKILISLLLLASTSAFAKKKHAENFLVHFEIEECTIKKSKKNFYGEAITLSKASSRFRLSDLNDNKYQKVWEYTNLAGEAYTVTVNFEWRGGGSFVALVYKPASTLSKIITLNLYSAAYLNSKGRSAFSEASNDKFCQEKGQIKMRAVLNRVTVGL